MKCREPEDSYEATAACRFCNAHLQHPFSLFGIRYIRSSGLAFGLRPPLVCRLAFERAFERLNAVCINRWIGLLCRILRVALQRTLTHTEQWRSSLLAVSCDPIPISSEQRRRRAAIPGQTVEKHKWCKKYTLLVALEGLRLIGGVAGADFWSLLFGKQTCKFRFSEGFLAFNSSGSGSSRRRRPIDLLCPRHYD